MPRIGHKVNGLQGKIRAMSSFLAYPDAYFSHELGRTCGEGGEGGND